MSCIPVPLYCKVFVRLIRLRGKEARHNDTIKYPIHKAVVDIPGYNEICWKPTRGLRFFQIAAHEWGITTNCNPATPFDLVKTTH
jgi:hypothetical protein